MRNEHFPLIAGFHSRWWHSVFNYLTHEGRGVAMFIGCGVIIFTTWTTAHWPNDLRRIDVLRVRELANVRRTVGEQIWPGWQCSASPLLLVKPSVEYLFDHPKPPEGFREIHAVSGAIRVYRQGGHVLPQLGLCALPIGGVTTVIVPDKRSFDKLGSLVAADESFLGRFTRHDTTDVYIIMCLHEAFHAYQQNLGLNNLLERLQMDAALPSTAAAALPAVSAEDAFEWTKLARLNDSQIKKRVAEAEMDGSTPKFLENECRALATALAAPDSRACRDKAKDFLAARITRRRAMTRTTVKLAFDEVANFEQAIEWVEGMARYTESRLCATLKSGAYAPTVEMSDDLDFMGYRQLHLCDEVPVAQAFKLPTRSRCYVTGAGLCCLLDRLDSRWKNKALRKGLPLEQLVADACRD